MNLISLRNKSPKGSSTAIDSPKIRPNIIAITEAIDIWVNKLPFNNFMFSTPFNLFYPLYHNMLFPRRQSYMYYLTFNTKQIIKIYSYKYLFMMGVHIFDECSHSIKKRGFIMKLKAIFCMLIVFAVMVFSLDTSSVYAYGWGFKKSTENRPPDVGEYDNLLENQEAIYKEDTDEKNIYLTFDNGYEQG